MIAIKTVSYRLMIVMMMMRLLLSSANDGDCDGILTVDDCDDNDNTDASFSGDCDQDGVATADDCDDSDPNNMSTPITNPGCCSTFMLEQINEDNDGDGSLGSGDTVTSYSYDANGNLATMTINNDVDNFINNSYTYTYNTSNQLTEREALEDGWLLITTIIYNLAGNLIREENDDMSDSSIDTITYYGYDAIPISPVKNMKFITMYIAYILGHIIAITREPQNQCPKLTIGEISSNNIEKNGIMILIAY